MTTGAYYVRAAILSPSPVLGRSLMWAQPICRSAAPELFVTCAPLAYFLLHARRLREASNKQSALQTRLRSPRAEDRAIAKFLFSHAMNPHATDASKSTTEIYKVAWRSLGLRSRWRALRPKNIAWLTTADTTATWKGFAIKKAGSGRCPVRNRSG